MEVSTRSRRATKRQKLSTTRKQHRSSPQRENVSFLPRFRLCKSKLKDNSAIDRDSCLRESNETKLTTQLSTEQHRSLCLVVLTREELERVASGEDGHSKPTFAIVYIGTVLTDLCIVDDSQDNFCLPCKQSGRLLNCLYCPRSYHPECLGPAQRGAPQSENWACPACSILHPPGPDSFPTTRKFPSAI
jgi:hypothetical protein